MATGSESVEIRLTTEELNEVIENLRVSLGGARVCLSNDEVDHTLGRDLRARIVVRAALMETALGKLEAAHAVR